MPVLINLKRVIYLGNKINFNVKEIFKNENKNKQKKSVQIILNKLIKNFIES